MDDAGSALRTVALFVVLLAAACGGYDDSGPASPDGRVTSLAIAEIPILRVGQTAQLVLTATMAGGRTQTVTDAAAWQSSATNVAAVSPRGLVTAVSVGISTVTASYQGATASIIVNVFVAPPPPQGLARPPR